MTALRDIDDVHAFVGAQVRAARPEAVGDDYGELLAEGVVILYELEAGFEEHREGYAQAGSFAGYAASLLPMRLRDAWRRLHPGAAPSVMVSSVMSLDADPGGPGYAATMVLRPDAFPAGTSTIAPFDDRGALRLVRAMTELTIAEETPTLSATRVAAKAQRDADLWARQEAAGWSSEDAGAAVGVGRSTANEAKLRVERALARSDESLKLWRDLMSRAGVDADRELIDRLRIEMRDPWEAERAEDAA